MNHTHSAHEVSRYAAIPGALDTLPGSEYLGGYVSLDPNTKLSMQSEKRGPERVPRFKDLHRDAWRGESWGVPGAPCGGATAEKLEDGRLTVVPLLCGKWSCPMCGWLRYYWFVTELRRAMKRHGLRYFWTLTIRQGYCTPQESYVEIQKGWNRLRTAIVRKYGALAYVWVVEGQKNGMAHLHLVWDRYVDVDWLRAAWERSFPGSRQVHVGRIGSDDGPGYLAKYLGKESGRSLVTEEGVDLWGKHRWGRSRGIDFRPYRVPTGGWTVVWEAYKDRLGEAVSRGALLESQEFGVPTMLVDPAVRRSVERVKSDIWLRLEENLRLDAEALAMRRGGGGGGLGSGISPG